MPLKSSDACPGCGRQIGLSKTKKGAFLCPICGCEFSHNLKKWLIGIPFGVTVAIALLYLTYDIVPPIFLAFFSAAVVALAISRMPSYIISVRCTVSASERESPNQAAEPIRTAVTPPASAGDRASGAPASP
jgi:hypothetical protein